MVDYRERRLDEIFYALSDGTRRAMLARLVKGECNVTELAEPFRMSLAAVSKHLKVLEAADLVRKEKDGRTIRCRPHFDSLQEANQLLGQLSVFWNNRLDALERFLATDTKEKGEKHGSDTAAKRGDKSTGARDSKSAKGKKRKGV